MVGSSLLIGLIISLIIEVGRGWEVKGAIIIGLLLLSIIIYLLLRVGLLMVSIINNISLSLILDNRGSGVTAITLGGDVIIVGRILSIIDG